ncbi:MAG: type II secretion system secretin GspD [Candidatus Rokubacteria bacterium]|nr:type II secretion system secretin GspD [Candidatus Rokubacteria bacterium]
MRPVALVVLLALLAPAGALRARAASPDEPVTLSFQDADLDVVLDAIAQEVGFNYILAPEVRRKVTVQGRVPRKELFDLLLSILEVHGLTAVKAGDVYKIVRIAAAQAQGLPVVVGLEPDPTRRPEEIVTQLVHLRYGAATEIARVLQPMVARETAFAVHRDTNVLVITDSVEKLRRYLSVIRMLDVPTAQEQLQVFPLRFADATALAPLITQLVGGPAASGARPAALPAPRAGEPAEAAAIAAPARDGGAGRPVILADGRTNALLAVGPPAVLERIQALVARLDRESPPSRGVFLHRVEHLRAKELAASLTALFRRRQGPEGGPPRPGFLPVPPAETPPGAPPPLPGGAEAEREDLATEDIRVIADEATNTLLVTATPHVWALLQPILQRLDRMPRRVLIEILVAEFTLDDSTALGIEWSLRSERGIRIGGERLGIGSGLDTGLPGIVPLPPTFFFVLQNRDILTLLQAFAKANRVNVLSTPHVLASENKRAQIHVGRSVPILTTQQQPTTGIAPQAQPTSVITTTVEYRDTGIILTVTPRVSDNRFVALDVRQEVSDAVPNVISGTQSPVITKRVAETSVVVGENETLVLGGLIEERKVQDREGIPFLSRIPILGYLFGTTTEITRKTELVILVTPRVILDPAEAQAVYEEFKRRAPELRQQIEDPNRPVPPPPSRPAPRSLAPTAPELSSR